MYYDKVWYTGFSLIIKWDLQKQIPRSFQKIYGILENVLLTFCIILNFLMLQYAIPSEQNRIQFKAKWQNATTYPYPHVISKGKWSTHPLKEPFLGWNPSKIYII